MNNQKTSKIVIGVLTIVLLSALGSLGFAIWQNSWWKAENEELACNVGALRAVRDFQAGKLRLLVIAGKNMQDKFSGTNDGPFEVWISTYLPEAPYPDRCSFEWEVRAYNAIMKHKLHDQDIAKQRSVTVTNTVAPTNLR